MAQLSNTYETYDAAGIREELADKIWKITPEETPFLSLIGKSPVKTTHPEWQVDENAVPDTDNAQIEGDDWSYQAITPTDRVGNYTQISDKRIIISRTLEHTDKAGRKSELAREIAKKGVELKTDMEVICLSNQASSAGAGDGATKRRLGGFRAWLESNSDLGTGGADGGFNSGTGIVDAATNGTQRAFTQSIMDDVIIDTYNSGGNPRVLMVSPYVKTVFSGFVDASGNAQPRQSAAGKSMKIVSAADIYLSDFGEISVTPNRQMARAGASVARNAFLIDPTMVSLGVFDDIKREKPAKTGDAEKRVLVTEYTLCVKNEKSHGVAADLFGMSASS